MPAIDLARLKKQTAQLADLFDQPSAFLRELREVLEFYVNRTLRSQSVAPSSVLPTYRPPVVVLRQVEKEKNSGNRQGDQNELCQPGSKSGQLAGTNTFFDLQGRIHHLRLRGFGVLYFPPTGFGDSKIQL